MKLKLILLSLLAAGAATAATYLDASFDPGTGANGLVESVLPLANGKILICGSFTSFNGVARTYIARLNANGALDTSFNASPSYWVRTMALQADGKIIIGGFFTSVSGASRNLVARLNANGSLDETFNPGTGATGTLGTSVTDNSDPFVFATAVQANGKILITGNFTNYNGAQRWGIARLNTDGSLDTTFDVGAGFNYNSWGRSLLVQKNGQIMVTGWFTSYNNHSYNRMVRLNPDGSADATFNPSFGDLTAIYSAVQLADGEYLVAGDSQNPQLFRQNMARLHADGSFNTAFVGADNDKTESIRLQSDGKILIGGYFSQVAGVTRNNLARLNADGTLDPSFTPSVNNFVWSIAVQAGNRILIVGAFSTVEGVSRNGIARLLPSASGKSPPPPDPFQGFLGTYTGLFYNADNFTNADAGYISVTVGARGKYSAGLALNGAGYTWSGQFDPSSVAQKTIARGRLDPIVVNWTLQNDESLQGTVAVGALTSHTLAYKAVFSRANPATAYVGRYTAILGGGAEGAPDGDGWLALSVSPLGAVTIGGMLADGAPIVRGAWLSGTGMAPFYIANRNGREMALGWLSLVAGVHGSIYWEKNFKTLLPVNGAAYLPPARGHSALAQSNLVLTASGGDLTQPATANFTLNPAGRFLFPASTNRFSGALNPVNGVFSGGFLDSTTHRPAGFRGVVVQGANVGGGFFGAQAGLVTVGTQ